MMRNPGFACARIDRSKIGGYRSTHTILAALFWVVGMNAPLRELSQAERLIWLYLSRTEKVGPVTFFQLLRQFGSTQGALLGAPDLARRGGGRPELRIFPAATAEREIGACAAMGARLICTGGPDYPPQLGAIVDPPPVITIRGHGHLLAKPMIGVVAARNASASGNRFARQIATDLGAEDFVICSGLAREIDASGTVPLLPVASIWSIHRRSRTCTNVSPNRAPSSPRCPMAQHHEVGFSPAQPHHFRSLAWHSGDRGGAALGLADHRPHGRRGRP